MVCTEIQAHLWDIDSIEEESAPLQQHVKTCSACRSVLAGIGQVRASLRPDKTDIARLSAGILARIVRRRRHAWPAFIRYAAGFLIGILGLATFWAQRDPPPSVPTRVVLPARPFENLLSKLPNDPMMESVLLRAVNVALRERAELLSHVSNREVFP